MTQVIEITATWRKTKTGEWVAFGKAADLKAALDNDLSVTMVRKDGTRQSRDLAKLGRTFKVDGVDMVYGYLKPETRTYSPVSRRRDVPGYVKLAAATRPAQPARGGGRCDECGGFAKSRVPARDLSGISGMVCRPCKSDEGHLSFA